MKGKYFFEPKRDLFWKTNQGTRGLCYALCAVVYSVTVGLPAWLLLVTVQLKLSPLKYIFKSHLFIGVCVCVCFHVHVGSEDTFLVLGLTFHCLGLRDASQASGLGGKYLYLLSEF